MTIRQTRYVEDINEIRNLNAIMNEGKCPECKYTLHERAGFGGRYCAHCRSVYFSEGTFPCIRVIPYPRGD